MHSTLALVLVAAMRAGSLGALIAGGLLTAGVLIGFWVREFEELRRFWSPVGILLAFLAGAVVFLFGHYGQNNCWP
jgi:O-antigen ligase